MRKLEYIGKGQEDGYTVNIYSGKDLIGRAKCEFKIVSEHFLIIMRQMGRREMLKYEIDKQYSSPKYKAILESNTTKDEAKEYCKKVLEKLVDPSLIALSSKYANGL